VSSSADFLDADPDVRMAALARMRSRCPVVPPATDHSPWVAVSHDAVGTVLREVDTFGGSVGSKGLDEEDMAIAAILEPRHGQIRRVINTVVAFHRSQQIEPYLDDLCRRLVARFGTEVNDAGPEGVDIMPIAVDPVPPSAMARLMGFPERDALQYYGWADEATAAFTVALAEGHSMSMADPVPEFTKYVEDRIAERQAMPADEWPEDALTRFLTTEIDGVRLTPRSIRVQILFMISAGSDTTRNLIGSSLYRLAMDAELYARVRADRSLIDAVIEETLRIDPPAQFLVRRCLAETNLEGTDLDEGDQVMISLSSANWDEAVFPEPSTFDLERATVREHFAFGSGPHICPGASLARLEARTFLHAFLDRFATVALGEGYRFDHQGLGMVHGPHKLQLVATAE
jgi:cytochrome P450